MLRGCGWVVTVVLIAGCGEGDEGVSFDYPKDEALAFQHVQGKGTHNSYHIEPASPVDEWRYTHLPLGQQLEDQGVRQFELDLNVNAFDERFEVYHIVRIDDQTTCFLFTDCLRDLKDWSDDHPAHHPIVVMLELKDGFDEGFADQFFAIFEDELESVWPVSRLITPDFVRGNHATLAEALAERGWPSLGELRGKALFFLLDSGDHRRVYTYGDASLDGRLAFVTAELGAPYAAIDALDNPIGGRDDIEAAVAANMLVRTRIDGEVTETGPQLDPDRLDAAMAVGAHFLSTDVPATSIGDGTPSRCNPVTAPADCRAADIEDPAFMQ